MMKPRVQSSGNFKALHVLRNCPCLQKNRYQTFIYFLWTVRIEYTICSYRDHRNIFSPKLLEIQTPAPPVANQNDTLSPIYEVCVQRIEFLSEVADQCRQDHKD